MFLGSLLGFHKKPIAQVPQVDNLSIRTEPTKTKIHNVASGADIATSSTHTDSLPIIEPPQGWSVYTDKGLDYGFAYDKGWSVESATNAFTRITYGDFKIEIVRLPNTEKSLVAFVDSQHTLMNDEYHVTFVGQTEISVDGYNAETMIERIDGLHIFIRSTYIEKGDYVYIIAAPIEKQGVTDVKVLTFVQNFKFSLSSLN